MTEITATQSTRSGGVPAWARVLAPLVVMGVIFWFSAQPYDGHEMAWWEVAARNLGHFGGYAVLASAWVWALGRASPGRLAAAGALALGYAIADEYHQTFVDGRTGSADDVVVDSLGIAAALVLARAHRRRLIEKRRLS